MPDGIRQLEKLETLEVSLVPKGANKRRFAIRKAEETTMQEIINAVLSAELDNEAQVDKVLKAAGMSDKAIAACKSMLKLATGFKDEMPKDLMTMLAKLAGYAGGVEKADKGPSLEDLPAEARAHVEALFKASKAAEDRAAKAEALLKAERDERRTKEFVAKAAEELPHLPGAKADELGPVLKSLADVSPADYEKILGVLKAADAAIKASEVLAQVGRGGQTSGIAGTAWGQIEKLAEGLVQKGDRHATRAQAIDEVLKTAQGKALYQEYLAEHPAQTGLK